jgi:hypothetical protein
VLTIGIFLGKAAYIVHSIEKIMSYLPGKLGARGKTINNMEGHVDSMIECYPKD